MNDLCGVFTMYEDSVLSLVVKIIRSNYEKLGM